MSCPARADQNRFAPLCAPARGRRTPYASANKERLRALIRQGKDAKEVEEELVHRAGRRHSVSPHAEYLTCMID